MIDVFDFDTAIRRQQEHGEPWTCPVCGKEHTVPKVFPRKDEAKKEEKRDDGLVQLQAPHL